MGRELQTTKAASAAGGVLAALVLLAASFLVTALLVSGPGHAAAQSAAVPTFAGDPAVPCETPPIAWRDSKPLGLPFKHGRLLRGVQLPADGDDFFTWDLPETVSPNVGWRRWGADGTIRIVLDVLCGFHAAHPEAPRIGIADIARPRGGWFGKEYGGLGHASHQNGLDIDILYPRLDGIEAPTNEPVQIDRIYAQELVNRFVDAGAKYIFVGPHTRLTGPKGVVQKLVFHDEHMHVRFPKPLATGFPPPPVTGAPYVATQ